MSRRWGALPFACLGAAFALGAAVDPWYQTWAGFTMRQGNALQVLLGDSRRMFANHFFLKADAYFHSGYYPSIFDETKAYDTTHMTPAADGAEGGGHGDEHVFLGPPKDWIDSFGRKFFPSIHVHLDEGDAHACEEGHEHCEGHDHGQAKAGDADQVREIMPWIRMSVELDPHRVESYLVAAYWLRERMGRIDDAEQFLREGLRANPDSYELLCELGRIAFEDRKDLERARSMWQQATARWQQAAQAKADPDPTVLRQIISYRALLEEQEGGLGNAIELLKMGKDLSGGSPVFDERIRRLEKTRGPPAT